MKLDGDSTVLHPIHNPNHLQHESDIVEPIKHKPVKKIADEKRDGHFHEVEERGLTAVPLPSYLNDKHGFCPVSDFDGSDSCQDMKEGKDDEMDGNTDRYSPGESELVIKDLDLFTDKNVIDFDLPKVEARCGSGSDCHEIRDICVDKGVISDEKTLFEMNGDFGHENIVHPDKEVDISPVKEKVEKDCPMADVFAIPEEHKPVDPIGRSSGEHLVHLVEDLTSEDRQCDSSASWGNEAERQSEVSRDELIADSSNPFHETEEIERSGKEAAKDSNIISIQSTLAGNGEAESGSNEKEATSEANGLPYSSQVGSGTITFSFAATTPTPSERFLSLSSANKEFLESQDGPKISESRAYYGRDQHSLGESSFSILAGPSSGMIPYSGSLSLRSDSSTTSTRSFAFPVLQNEWNSSPVRMAKAERKWYRKQSGWRQVLCCKF